MRTETDQTEDFVSLCRSAFKEFGGRALSNVRELENPRLEDALAITRHLRVAGILAARRLAERIEQRCRAALQVSIASRAFNGRRLFVVFTVRGSLLRVISARNMSRRERGIYEEESNPEVS